MRFKNRLKSFIKEVNGDMVGVQECSQTKNGL